MANHHAKVNRRSDSVREQIKCILSRHESEISDSSFLRHQTHESESAVLNQNNDSKFSSTIHRLNNIRQSLNTLLLTNVADVIKNPANLHASEVQSLEVVEEDGNNSKLKCDLNIFPQNNSYYFSNNTAKDLAPNTAMVFDNNFMNSDFLVLNENLVENQNFKFLPSGYGVKSQNKFASLRSPTSTLLRHIPKLNNTSNKSEKFSSNSAHIAQVNNNIDNFLVMDDVANMGKKIGDNNEIKDTIENEKSMASSLERNLEQLQIIRDKYGKPPQVKMFSKQHLAKSIDQNDQYYGDLVKESKYQKSNGSNSSSLTLQQLLDELQSLVERNKIIPDCSNTLLSSATLPEKQTESFKKQTETRILNRQSCPQIKKMLAKQSSSKLVSSQESLLISLPHSSTHQKRDSINSLALYGESSMLQSSGRASITSLDLAQQYESGTGYVNTTSNISLDKKDAKIRPSNSSDFRYDFQSQITQKLQNALDATKIEKIRQMEGSSDANVNSIVPLDPVIEVPSEGTDDNKKKASSPESGYSDEFDPLSIEILPKLADITATVSEDKVSRPTEVSDKCNDSFFLNNKFSSKSYQHLAASYNYPAGFREQHATSFTSLVHDIGNDFENNHLYHDEVVPKRNFTTVLTRSPSKWKLLVKKVVKSVKNKNKYQRNNKCIGYIMNINPSGSQTVCIEKPPNGLYGFYIRKERVFSEQQMNSVILISRIISEERKNELAGLICVGDEILCINGVSIKDSDVTLNDCYKLIAAQQPLILEVFPYLLKR